MKRGRQSTDLANDPSDPTTMDRRTRARQIVTRAGCRPGRSHVCPARVMWRQSIGLFIGNSSCEPRDGKDIFAEERGCDEIDGPADRKQETVEKDQ
jgi:hypothetical protein